MYTEKVCLPGSVLLELRLRSAEDFLLTLKRHGDQLVEYRPGMRVVRGRRTAYEFRSVEKLRYDFEKDAEDAQRQG